jgi:phospholipid/cholesterol/gamma-HCH transport system substrate-binding protein
METRANHLLIGTFVLVFVAALAGFVIWLGKAQLDREVAYYDIYFSGSVAGLGQGGDVRFNGIRIGTVDRIRIDHFNPERVRVTVGVDPDAPIRADSIAELTPQGITGVVFVQISGGTRTAAQLPRVTSRAEAYPEIASRPSTLDELFQGVPNLLAKMNDLMDRATTLLAPENQQAIAGILADVKQVTGAIATREDKIGRIVDSAESMTNAIAETAKAAHDVAVRFEKIGASAERSMSELDRTMGAARGTMARVDTLLDRDAQPLITDARRTASALSGLAEQLRGTISANEQSIGEFANEGLHDFRQFVNDARILVSRLSRVAQRLEDDPSRLLFGTRESEYRPETR